MIKLFEQDDREEWIKKVMTDEQFEKAFESTVGMSPRLADRQVVKIMGGTVEVAAEYVWSHWMGEPKRPTVEEVEDKFIEKVKEGERAGREEV